MDILKNGYLQRVNIKRFTLSATAIAILSLNTETASAVSCPAIIAGTALAGQVCDFDTGASVVVVNGGNVAGINVNNFSASLVTVNAGGVIQGSGTSGIGINVINSSSLVNGIANNGTIKSLQTGILITSGSNVGSVTNNGNITVKGTAILITDSTINADILNTGTINAGGNDEGIFVGAGSNVNGNISSTGVINSINGNGILVNGISSVGGSISNGGTITVGDSGISISNQINVGGGVSNSGTITAGLVGMNIRQSSNIGGNVSNSGTINASGGITSIGIFVSSSTVNGNVSNSGSITAAATGIGLLSGTINGHIVNSGTIQGGVKAIHVDASSTVSDIDIIGTHARVIGAVDANSTNFNITSGANFTSEGTISVNNFNIAANAVFQMANTISVAGGFNNAGTLTVGSTSHTLNGNYTQNTGGVLQLTAVNASNYGQFLVSGAVNLSQSGNLNVQVTQNTVLHQGDVLSSVISGGTLITPTNGFNVVSSSYVWTFLPVVNASHVDLVASINPVAGNACLGDFCQGAANVILGQITAGNSAFSPYNAPTTQSAFITAVSQATPELTNENTQVAQLSAKAVMDVAPMWSMLHGKSAGDAMLYQPGKVWLKPYAGSMTQDEQNSVPGFNATTYGVVIGKDVQLIDNWMLGGAFAIGDDNVSGKSALNTQSLRSTLFQGIIYGAKQFSNHIYLATQGLVGYGDNHSSRNIPLYASTANGSYNSWFTSLRAAMGWSTFALNQNLIITPEVDIDYFYINQGSYKESGSPMDLNVSSSNNSFLTLGAYGNGAYHLTTLKTEQDVTLTGYVGIAGNVLNTQPQTVATFVAGGPSFATYGVQSDSVLFRGGIGLSVGSPTKPLSVNLNYDLQTGNSAYSGVGSLTIKYNIA